MMIRHSQRTVKCRRCGKRDFYWWHDSNRTGRRACDEHDGFSSWVLVRADTEYLQHKRYGQGCTDTQYVPESASDGDGDAFRVQPEPQPQSADDTDDDTDDDSGSGSEMDELRRILSSIVGASVDEGKVRAIVDDRLAGFSAPTRVTVHDKRTDDERELPDVAHHVLPKVIMALDAEEHVWLVGPAGTGKSTIASQAADALGLQFGSISLSPNTPGSEIVGYRDANGNYHGTVFRDLYENGGLFLFDEVDNGHPSTLAKVNMALANGHMAFPDGMVKRNPDFRCLAAANTYGDGPDRQYVGRLKIDAATLDRFATVYVGVDEALEESIAYAQGADSDATRKLLYLVRKLRNRADNEGMPVMFSPRASINGAKLLAAGFDFEDVVAMRVRKGISDADWQKLDR